MSNPSKGALLRLVPEPDPLTTGEYLARWLSSRRSLRPATVRTYRNHIDVHLIPKIGDIPLDQLSLDDVERMYDALLSTDSHLSIASVHRVHSALNAALNHAVRSGLIATNPARLADLPKIPTSRPHAWSGQELMDFLSMIESDPLHPLFALLGLRGLRRGEALGLRWVNVDLQRFQIRILEQLGVGESGYAIGPPKSKAGVRTVAIDESLAELLALHSVRQREVGVDSALVFSDRHGQPLKPAYVTRYFDRLVRETGARRVRLHDLRHGSATIGLASGESLLEISRRLGHSSVAITADLYTEIPPETAHASAERLAAYLRPRHTTE